mmetsp:Transcript_9919/g.24269  ORF Transcript_9919/g.24269 Transcript_9919/m.24269 type:complete len:246 (+) Transcript_9919:378-1115(+)
MPQPPSVKSSPVLASKSIRHGIPETSYAAATSPRRLAEASPSLPNGSALKGIEAWYSSKLAASRSSDTNTTSNFLASLFTLSYAAASFGVNPRHGGHQCALKYSPTTSSSLALTHGATAPPPGERRGSAEHTSPSQCSDSQRSCGSVAVSAARRVSSAELRAASAASSHGKASAPRVSTRPMLSTEAMAGGAVGSAKTARTRRSGAPCLSPQSAARLSRATSVSAASSIARPSRVLNGAWDASSL